MWFLTPPPPPHTCFRLGTREWLLVYTCVSARKPRGSCTNTRACYCCIVVNLIPTAGRLQAYITKSSDRHNTAAPFENIPMNGWYIWMPKCPWVGVRQSLYVDRVVTQDLSIYILRTLQCETRYFLQSTFQFIMTVFTFFKGKITHTHAT